jgi:hypothetical protein
LQRKLKPDKKERTSFLTLPAELRQQILLESFMGKSASIQCSSLEHANHGCELKCLGQSIALCSFGKWWLNYFATRHAGSAMRWAEYLNSVDVRIVDDVDYVYGTLAKELDIFLALMQDEGDPKY